MSNSDSSRTLGWSVGVDIGGTFTDVVAVNPTSGARLGVKVLTTPADPLVGVLDGLKLISTTGGVEVTDCDHVVHATTLAINTLIERTGARVAMLTTRGFRDIIETGHEDRYDLYDLQIELQPPLIPRPHRIPVTERMDARGEIVTSLDTDELRTALGQMTDVESVAVCFLHSYANQENERLAADIAKAALGDVHISLSSDVAPIVREYERFTAAAMNAYVGPRVSSYITALESELRDDLGFGGTIGIMKSDGGMCSPAEASAYPVRILESGPAAGILSAAFTASQCDEKLAVAFDMGGTTAKMCLVVDSEPVMTDELEVARLKRFKAGSGLPLRIPSLDLVEIGAGGGSIAWIDDLGMMQVGPESAGSVPGPACYGKGGFLPTVTDADCLLGYLDPKDFAGGAFPLDQGLAAEAVEERILQATRTTDVTFGAWGIHEIVNENMARATRLHCLEHGVDPTAVSLIATGGAGPVHAGAILAKVGARRAICPPSPGVASALGLLLAPRTRDLTVTDVTPIEGLTEHALRERFDRIEGELGQRSADDFGKVDALYYVEIRLRGQAYEVRVRVPDEQPINSLEKLFENEYAARFGRTPWQVPREIVRWTVLHVDRRRVVPAAWSELSTGERGATRTAYFGPKHKWCDTTVIDRGSLSESGPLRGPLVIPEAGSTIVVGPEQLAFVDKYGNVLIEPAQAASAGAAVSAAHSQERAI